MRRQENLPSGWVRLESRSRPGMFYYAHPATQRTQMERPVEMSGAFVAKLPAETQITYVAKVVGEDELAGSPLKSPKVLTKEEAQMRQQAQEQALEELEAEEAEKERVLRKARERRVRHSDVDAGNEDFEVAKKRRKKKWENESDEDEEPHVTAEEIEKWSELEERREREEEQDMRKRKEAQEKREAEYEEALEASRRRSGQEQRSKQQAALELARQMVSERLQTATHEARNDPNDVGSGSNTVSFGSRATRELKTRDVKEKPSAASHINTKDKQIPLSTKRIDGDLVHETVRQAPQASKKVDSDDECCVLDVKLVRKVWFSVGDRVRGKDSGKVGVVVSVDAEGDPKVKLDGEAEALQRFGREFQVLEKGPFSIGNRVLGKLSGKLGVVVSVDEEGSPMIRTDGEVEAVQRPGTEFVIVKEAFFGVGDRVKGKESGKLGTVVSVDTEGDPKVLLDGESVPLPRFGHEFRIFRKVKPSIPSR